MLPVLFRVGGFEVESFWTMLFAGFLAALWVARSELGRLGHDPRLAYDLILYSYIGGLIGARLLLLVTAWDVFVTDPFGVLFSGSGWVWQGGLMGGAVAVILGARECKLPVRDVAEFAGSCLALGQAIGRIGCQLAGDGDYGKPSDLPWAMSYPHGVVPTTERVHPAPLYEMGLYLLIFFWLWRRRRGPHPRGLPFAEYLIATGVARFGVEFVRINPVAAMGLTIPQWISLASVITGVLLYVVLARRPVAPSVARLV